MKVCMKGGCFISQGNHHSSLHEERAQKSEESLISYTPSNDCIILPGTPAHEKGRGAKFICRAL